MAVKLTDKQADNENLQSTKNKLVKFLSGILRDKTMEDKIIYIPNNDKQLPLFKI